MLLMKMPEPRSIRSDFAWLIRYLWSRPTEAVIERNGKLFQTYLIVFSLLLACNLKDSTQEAWITPFALFICFGLIYYIMLTRFPHRTPLIFLDYIALIMGVVFSNAFVPFLNTSGILRADQIYWAMIILISISLFA